MKKKFVIFLYIYAIIFLSYFTTNTLSKYFTVLPESENTLDVAKWEVYADTSDNPLDSLSLVSGNGNQNYIVKVTSKSDIAVSYLIEISNIPSGISVKVDDRNFVSPTNGKVIVENAGSFVAGNNNAVNTHTLTFKSSLGSGNINNSRVKIDVIFVQDDLSS